jgi:alkylhydroperoxidase family enzyme
LDDWHTAPIQEKLRTTLGFLEKLTLAPGTVGSDDVMSLRAAGVSDQAIEDAIAVCTLFNILDRLADALGFVVPPAEDFAGLADFLLTFGYQPQVSSS